ncbi:MULTISPECIES: hypothetical protein [unclassified Synechocystis]|uniref:hypothetical protein n=1 Tax=unclassified Synechocystis TaxID=2640012 RepID=UPI0004D0C11A|nr:MULTISPECIES: hypothetical protein [unclassified Synechocystis]AIE73014.1 hypothetical protein D082_04850 [Synechocystis sp. PCC 6714]MCT0253534.1 hypothetical protein [Synechocystis sp. CS-94]
MTKKEIKGLVDYLTYLDEVLQQLGTWEGSTGYCDYPINLTHCEKYHLARLTLPKFREIKRHLIAIHDKLPSEGEDF